MNKACGVKVRAPQAFYLVRVRAISDAEPVAQPRQSWEREGRVPRINPCLLPPTTQRQNFKTFGHAAIDGLIGKGQHGACIASPTAGPASFSTQPTA
jgi:hypothetical protein